jgi:integrase
MFNRLKIALGPFSMSDIDREVIYAVRDQFIAAPTVGNMAVEVIRVVFSWAVDRGRLKFNPALRIKRRKENARKTVWSEEVEAKFMAVADEPMQRAFKLMLYTAQGQADALKCTWTEYVNKRVTFTQGKTGSLVDMPAAAHLRMLLDTLPRVSTHVLVDCEGRPWKARTFQKRWRETMDAAGVKDVQNRDLRRTAMVRLAEAGATIPQIAAISGHSIEETQRILEVYIPRTAKMADEAIRKLDAAERRAGRGPAFARST